MSRYFKVSEPIPSPVMVYESNGDIVFYSRGTEILRMNDRFVVLYGKKLESPDDYEGIFNGLRDFTANINKK